MGETNGPILPGERILALDVIRGVAMFGVLAAYCAWSLGTLPPEAYTPLDHLLEGVIAFAIDNKFYTLLAFLFGLGFQLQLSRGERSEGERVRFYRRRLLVLAGIGFAHAILLRNGDILLPYALTGLVLVPLRGASDRMIVTIAFFSLAVAHGARLLWEPSGLPMPERPAMAGQPYLVENLAWVRYWYLTAVLTWPINLTLFLFGFLAGRHGWLTQIAADRRRTMALLVGGLTAGIGFFLASTKLAGALNAAGLAPMLPIATLLFTFHAWGMASAYVALVLLALGSVAGRSAAAPFAAVGRMALTNYLMQAGVIVPLCLALGWFDRFTPSRAMLLVVVYFPMQAVFSLLWLRRFDFGPAEWCWRRLAYGKALPSRRVAAAKVR